MKFKELLSRHTILKCAMILASMFSLIGYGHELLGPYMKVLLIWAALEVLAGFIIDRKLLKDIPTWLLMGFLALYAVSALRAGADTRMDTLKSIAYMGAMFLICYQGGIAGSPAMRRTESQLIARFAVICITVMEIACFAVYEFADAATYVCSDGVIGYIGSMDGRLCGLVHMNVIGAVSALGIILGAGMTVAGERGIFRIICIVCIIFGTVCLVLSYSRTAIIGLAVAGLYSLYAGLIRPGFQPEGRGTRRICAIAVTCLAAGVLAGVITYYSSRGLLITKLDEVLSWANGTLSGRIEIWTQAIDSFKDSLIFGSTYEGFMAGVHEISVSGWEGGGVHSIYLGVLTFSGIAGCAALAAFTVVNRRKLRRSGLRRNPEYIIATMAVIFLLIQGATECYLLFGFSFFAVIYWTCMGIRRERAL